MNKKSPWTLFFFQNWCIWDLIGFGFGIDWSQFEKDFWFWILHRRRLIRRRIRLRWMSVGYKKKTSNQQQQQQQQPYRGPIVFFVLWFFWKEKFKNYQSVINDGMKLCLEFGTSSLWSFSSVLWHWKQPLRISLVLLFPSLYFLYSLQLSLSL